MKHSERKTLAKLVASYPGATFTVEPTKRHERVVIAYKGGERSVIKSKRPGCPHAAMNFVADVKRAFRELDHG